MVAPAWEWVEREPPERRSTDRESGSRRKRHVLRHYKCTNCGYELDVSSTQNLPPCPSCENGEYDTVSDGDSTLDPYPDRKSTRPDGMSASANAPSRGGWADSRLSAAGAGTRTNGLNGNTEG